MVRQDVDDRLAIFDAAARRNLVAEHRLFAVVMHERAEDEAAAAARLHNRPAGEAARDLLNVLLRVAAFDAQRVQLHQLARVVFIDAGLALLGLLRGGLCALLLLGAHLPVIRLAQPTEQAAPL